MKAKTLDGQLSLNLFDKPKHEQPNYPKPCPIREDCGAYHRESGGCDGNRGVCTQAQLASGIDIGEWRWSLMSKQERKARLKKLVGHCTQETSVVDVGGGKSFCKLMNAYTNCREVKHCVYWSMKYDN